MSKKIHIFSIIGLLFISYSLVVFYYWSFIQPDIIKFNNPDSIQVDKTSYFPGERITYTLDYCKTRNLIGIVNRSLQDTYRITYTTVNSNIEVGCHVVKVNDLTIPDFIKGDGKTYHLSIMGQYKINPLRTQVVNLKTVDFLIE